MKSIPILVLTVFVSGCDLRERQPQHAQQPTQPPQPYQRFLPIQTDNKQYLGFFALDTQTGLLCRTAEWDSRYKGQEVPTCSSLAKPLSPEEAAKVEGLIKKYKPMESFKEWKEKQDAKPRPNGEARFAISLIV
jgi:hypothetical protein